jgi:hypothetical protein
VKKFIAGLFLGAAVGAGGTVAYLFKSKRIRTLAKRELEYKVQELADRLIFGDEERPSRRRDQPYYGGSRISSPPPASAGYVPPKRRPFRYGPPPRVPYERYRP